ncbi:isopentenyl-diphosphate Delta-isomerase [Primorskyibacter sp. S187A]|uniref:isopentenyl-diphosphate Delta-isomerase n=1 Tax=Primorskyibacter sp. S187A TaxID=3415130 RepID=UPI003C7D830C
MSILIPAWVDGKLEPVEKLDVHKRGLRHKAVSVFVLRDEQILLQQRALEKYHTPGLWANTCCTHPDWGESSEACAIRRLKEELGITGQVPQFRQRAEYRADVGNGMIEHELVDIFIVDATRDMGIELNPEEVRDTRWISFADLAHEVATRPEIFTPWLRIYLQEHSVAIFGRAGIAAQ